MDALVGRVQLVHSSSEDSFEHIDPDFDNSYYQELRGVAVADFLPLETNEILLRKGTASSSERIWTFVSVYCILAVT